MHEYWVQSIALILKWLPVSFQFFPLFCFGICLALFSKVVAWGTMWCQNNLLSATYVLSLFGYFLSLYFLFLITGNLNFSFCSLDLGEVGIELELATCMARNFTCYAMASVTRIWLFVMCLALVTHSHWAGLPWTLSAAFNQDTWLVLCRLYLLICSDGLYHLPWFLWILLTWLQGWVYFLITLNQGNFNMYLHKVNRY